MSRAERARWLRIARENLGAVLALRDTDGASFVAAVLRVEERRQRVPVVFRSLGGDRWEIHHADEAPAEYRCELAGLRAAWLAIDDAGRTQALNARDFAEPGALHAARIVRRAIRVTAADWVERTTGCLALAAALRAIRVTVSGLVVYERCAASHPIITR